MSPWRVSTDHVVNTELVSVAMQLHMHAGAGTVSYHPQALVTIEPMIDMMPRLNMLQDTSPTVLNHMIGCYLVNWVIVELSIDLLVNSKFVSLVVNNV